MCLFYQLNLSKAGLVRIFKGMGARAKPPKQTALENPAPGAELQPCFTPIAGTEGVRHRFP
jgi:hypothetical protein